jgi:ADP-ribose pyrophosphatase
MTTLIIVDGLTPENFSPAEQFGSRPENLGRQEIGRLVGLGRSAGHGPLPRFVQAAADLAREHAEELRLLFLTEEHGGERAAEETLIDAVREFARGFDILEAAQGSVPWRRILDIAGGSPGDAVGAPASPKRALLVGAHTELRITSIAAALKNLLSFDSVAVCPHLVGSATREAHFAALRYGLPALGVEVLLDIDDAARYVGIDSARFADLDVQSCTLGPPDIVERLDKDAQDMIKRLCMHWTGASLRTLTGGFSGSLLFIAEGQQGQARTEPMVIKIDNARQMRRELAGYYRVRDLVGKHVPAFGLPVIGPDLVGIGMELAAMEGAPETLQDLFEEAHGDESARVFQERFEKSLRILTERLYRNTARDAWIVPYREFQMHTDEQVTWLGENIENIVAKATEEGIPGVAPDAAELQVMLRLVARNENGTTSSICLSHGDLNYQNIIADQATNLWFIDWTHAGDTPVALDFAKLENDVKFVMSKDFNADDMPRLRLFEEYLLENPEPGHAEALAESLGFVKWDLRYRKILDAVRQIREVCFELLPEDGWLVYRIALLRYATHTLSFDQWGGRGECGPVALLHALHSVEALLYQLVADDFHLRIRIEKPEDYPNRQVILIDEAPWSVDSDRYDPPYYVAPDVLVAAEADERLSQPEDFEKAADLVNPGRSERTDEAGRPLNPRGRTGLAGRGSLIRWGANPGIAAAVVRRDADGGGLQFLVGKQAGQLGASLPRDLLELGESANDGLRRILSTSAGVNLDDIEARPVFDDFFYDFRQTDHAWVELEAWLIGPDERLDMVSGGPTEVFDETDWWPLDKDTMNKLPSGDARLIARALDCLRASGQLSQSVEEPKGSPDS